MSSQAEQEFIDALREDGTLDSLGINSEAPAEAETVEEPEVEVPAAEPPAEEPEETPAVEEPEEPAASYEADEEDAEYVLDAGDPDIAAYLEKYGGDLTAAIRAAANAQSLIGRQGNELGDVRRELQELREQVMAPQQEQYQPYQTFLPDPDDAEESEMAAAYGSLAREAFERKDATTLQQAVEGWKDYDPFGASVFVSQLQARIYEERFQEYAQAGKPDELAQGMEQLKTKYPDMAGRVAEIADEAERWPTLGRVLYDGETTERVQALEALYLQVANRTSSETSQQALKRVAVKQSEEARKARQQAQVAGAGRGSVAAPETGAQKIALGRTGRFVDLNRVDEILQSDRI